MAAAFERAPLSSHASASAIVSSFWPKSRGVSRGRFGADDGTVAASEQGASGASASSPAAWRSPWSTTTTGASRAGATPLEAPRAASSTPSSPWPAGGVVRAGAVGRTAAYFFHQLWYFFHAKRPMPLYTPVGTHGRCEWRVEAHSALHMRNTAEAPPLLTDVSHRCSGLPRPPTDPPGPLGTLTDHLEEAQARLMWLMKGVSVSISRGSNQQN